MDMNVEEALKTDKPILDPSRTIIHMNLVCNKINEAMSNALKPFDISMQQFNVLRILRGQHNKPANLSTVNERMITKMSNTSRLVDKLILKGYVNRTVCPTNRRKVEILITDTGQTDLLEMDSAIMETQKDLLKNFNPRDLEALNRLLDKF